MPERADGPWQGCHGISRAMPVMVRMKRLRKSDGDIPVPQYMSAMAAGMDLAAALDAPVTLEPGSRIAVPSGFALEIPPGYEGQIRPRSGLALRHGVTVANAPGTIDADFRGELQVLLVNLGRSAFVIERGMRIAQLVIAPVLQASVELADDLTDTARGQNGFGSSGS